jgi:hypothetical protein
VGLEILSSKEAPFAIEPVLARLAADGLACKVVMVDNLLCDPSAPPPRVWRDLRLKTPHGMVTLVAREGGTAVVVFGNAGTALQEDQRRVAAALAP